MFLSFSSCWCLLIIRIITEIILRLSSIRKCLEAETKRKFVKGNTKKRTAKSDRSIFRRKTIPVTQKREKRNNLSRKPKRIFNKLELENFQPEKK